MRIKLTFIDACDVAAVVSRSSTAPQSSALKSRRHRLLPKIAEHEVVSLTNYNIKTLNTLRIIYLKQPTEREEKMVMK
jgi:hypothetical protein